MNHMKPIDEEPKKSNTPLIVGVIAVAVVAVVIACVFVFGGKKTSSQTGEDSQETVSTTADAPVATTEDGTDSSVAAEEETYTTTFTTPVGELGVPNEYGDSVSMVDESEGDQYIQAFYGTVQGEQVLLYRLSIGNNGAGYQLGTVTGSDGAEQQVWLEISEIESKENWTEEEISNINLEQAGVNDLIDQIYAIDGFKAVE